MPETNLYNMEHEAVLTIAGANAHLATAEWEDVHGTGVIPDHTSDYVHYLISNNPGVELPATGGPGTMAFYILGIMLTAFTGAGLVMRRRRRYVA